MDVKSGASEPAPDAATTTSPDAPDNTTSKATRDQQSPTTAALSAKLSGSMSKSSKLEF